MIYTFSIICLFILSLLIERKKEKINMIKSIAITIVCLVCYNTFICFLFSSIRIPITLVSLAICNFCISIILIIDIIKKKKVQKYIVKIKDIIAISIILGITVTTAFWNFTSELNIKYIMTDAAVHFRAAREFYENDALLDKTENTTTSKIFMAGAYTNTGILFKVFEPIVGEENLYKLFIIFDIFTYFMSGLIMYVSINKFIKSKLGYILSLIFTLIFMLGYPYNCLIYGYAYLQVGIIIAETIVAVFQDKNEEYNKKIVSVQLLLLNFGLFFSYLLLIPVVYLAEGLYFLFDQYRNNRKYFSKENIVTILITLIIPAILGIVYFVIPQFFQEQKQLFLTVEGYIYRNYWSNFIIILPLTLLCFKLKNKDVQFLSLLLLTLIFVMILMFIAVRFLNFSTYYYCKFNFLLWFLLWYGAMVTVNLSTDKLRYKIVIICYTIFYLIFAVNAFNKGTPITKEYYSKETLMDAFDIFGINKTIALKVSTDFTKEDMDLVNYVRDNIDLENEKMLIISKERQEHWIFSLLNYKNREESEMERFNVSEVDMWNEGEKYKYAIVFFESEKYNILKDNFIEKNVIFRNEKGVIYENY